MSNSFQSGGVIPRPAENRRYSRFSVLFASVNLSESAVGFVLNLGQGGLCVQVTRGVLRGGSLRLRFQSLDSASWVAAPSRIVWADESQALAGIEFVDLSSSAAEEVGKWITFGASLQELREGWTATRTDKLAEDIRTIPDSMPGSSGSAPQSLGDEEAGIESILKSVAARPAEAGSFAGERWTSPSTSAKKLRTARWVAASVIVVSAAVIWKEPLLRDYRASTWSTKNPLLSVVPEKADTSGKRENLTGDMSASPLQGSILKTTPEPSGIPTHDSQASSGPDANGFVLQVAAMRNKQNATNLSETLRAQNFPTFVTGPSGEGFYKVIVGPYPNAEALRSAKDAIRKTDAEIQPVRKRWLGKNSE